MAWVVREVPQIETRSPDGKTTWRNVMSGYPHGHMVTGNKRSLYGAWDSMHNTVHASFFTEEEAIECAEYWNDNNL